MKMCENMDSGNITCYPFCVVMDISANFVIVEDCAHDTEISRIWKE